MAMKRPTQLDHIEPLLGPWLEEHEYDYPAHMIEKAWLNSGKSTDADELHFHMMQIREAENSFSRLVYGTTPYLDRDDILALSCYLMEAIPAELKRLQELWDVLDQHEVNLGR